MAKTQVEVLDMLRVGENLGLQPFLLQWKNVFYRTSIHTTGTCPRFRPMRETNGIYGMDTTTWEYPAWWINANYDWVFETHLLNRYPREPEITRNFRKSVYRPYQMAPLLECINSLVTCILGDNRYTLTVEDTADNDYIWDKNFEGKTLIEYFQWKFKAICEDPNSLFVVMPNKGRTELSAGEKISPTIKHVPTVEILYITEDEIVFYEPYTNGQLAWWVTDMGYFRFRKGDDGNYVNIDGNKDGYFAHLLTRRPVHFAGGIWNNLRYYDSYLKAALPYCDDLVSQHSDVQMINKEACFPFIQVVEEDCPTCSGLGQLQFCTSCYSMANSCSCSEETMDLIKQKCHACNGSGNTVSFNPGQRIQVPKDQADKELMKIINFDVNINKHIQETANGIKEGIKKALHQQYVDEAQSGIAKEIDREAEYLYRSAVSNGVWNLIENVLIDILSIRHTDASGKVTLPRYELVRPTDFALKTDMDLLKDYKESTDANMPAWVRQAQVAQYVDKIFGGSDIMKKKASVINQIDAYSVHTPDQKSAMLAANAITIEAFTLSNNASVIIDKLIRKNGSNWFVNASYEDIETQMLEQAKLIQLPPKPDALDETITKINE